MWIGKEAKVFQEESLRIRNRYIESLEESNKSYIEFYKAAKDLIDTYKNERKTLYKITEEHIAENRILKTQVKELTKVDKQNNLIKLPCEIGDAIYTFSESDGIETLYVDTITLCTLGLVVVVNGCYYRLDELGKTWFLNKDDIEEALKEE